MRIYLGIPAPKSTRMSDFKMADDAQKLQMMIGMASNKKLDWDNILKEMGQDPEVVHRKIEAETQFETKLQRIEALAQASIQNEVQHIQMRQQREMQDAAIKEQMQAGGDATSDPGVNDNREETISAWAKKLNGQGPAEQASALKRLGTMDAQFAGQIRAAMASQSAPQASDVDVHSAQSKQPKQPQQPKPIVNMAPLPTQKPPRRAGGV